jgi:DNA repair exonuclease SbcCD ATPase subunit
MNEYKKNINKQNITEKEKYKLFLKAIEDSKVKKVKIPLSLGEDNKIKILSDDPTSIIQRLYHVSDIHIERDYKRRSEYIQVFNNLIHSAKKTMKKDSLWVLTGDVIDFKNNTTSEGVSMLILFLKMLSNEAPIICIVGNHDANTADPSCVDLISTVYKEIETKHPIYLLRESGVYRYNNVLFSVASVFDSKVIPANTINKRPNDYLTFLHHGFCYNSKLKKYDYIRLNKHIKTEQLEGYTVGLLGDIHQQIFLEPNIAYASSLLQRNYSEHLTEHGYIIWDLKKQTGDFIEVPNDYGFVTYILEQNKVKSKPKEIPKIARIKIKYKSTSKEFLKDFIEELKSNKSFKIERIDREKLFDKEDLKITLDNGKQVDKISITDQESIVQILKKYLRDVKKVTDISIEKVIKEHSKYYNKINKEDYVNKKIKLLQLSFNNMYSYGANNKLDFTELKGVSLLYASNGSGKSAIIDILCYLLFDRSLRDSGNKKNSLVNVHKKEFSAELELLVNDKQYKIKKSGTTTRRGLVRTVELFEMKENEYVNIPDYTTKDLTAKIQQIINLSYEDFVFSCLLPQYNSIQLLDIDNAKRKDVLSRCLKLDFFDDIHKDVNTDIRINKRELDILNARITDLEEEIKDYKSNLPNYKRLDKKSNIINKNIERKKNLLKVLRKEVKHVDNDEFKDADYIEEQLTQNLNNLKQLKNTIVNINNEITEIKENMKNIIDDKDIQQVEDTVKSKITRKINNSNAYNKHTKEIDNIMSFVKPFNSNNKKLSSVIVNIVNTNVDDVKEQYSRLERLYDRTKDLTERKANILNKISQLKGYKVVVNNNTQLQEEIDEAEEELEDLEYDREEINNGIKKYEAKKAVYKKTLVEYDKLITERKKLSNTQDSIMLYRDAVGKDGIKMMILKTVCSSIEINTNSILERFSDLKIRIDLLSTAKCTTIGIMMVDKEREYVASNASGYEKLSINIALKIALSKFSNISVPSFLIIDEALSCIDKHNMNRVTDLFSYLRQTYDFCLVVTHIEQLHNKFDHSIEIRKRNGISKLVY